MNARIFLIFISLISSFLLVSTAQAATFLESGGVVVIEAESSTAAGQWARANKVKGAKGNAYLVWNGPDLFAASKAGQGTLTYTFRVQTAGNYELRWRSYIAHGTNATEANDSWVRFPTGKNIKGQHGLNGWTKAYQNQKGQWSWSAKTTDHVGNSIRQYFSKGDHKIQISGRSKGHAIDRIVMFRYASVSYGAAKFDNFSVSKTVGGTQAPQNTTPTVTPVAVVAKPRSRPGRANRAGTRQNQTRPVAVAQSEAPSVSADGRQLNWQAVDAKAINVHGANGEWLESLSGSATSWTAPANGSYFVVATNSGDWRTWGRSNEVEATGNAVNAQFDDAAASSDSSGSINSLSGSVYSKSALELFWSTDGDTGAQDFEVYRR